MIRLIAIILLLNQIESCEIDVCLIIVRRTGILFVVFSHFSGVLSLESSVNDTGKCILFLCPLSTLCISFSSICTSKWINFSLEGLIGNSFRLSERIIGILKVVDQADLVNFQVIAVEERSLFGGSSIHDDSVNLGIDQVDTLLTLGIQCIVGGICPDFEISASGVQRIKDVFASVVIVRHSARNERIFLHFWDLESKLVVGVDLIHLERILLGSLEGAFSKVKCELIVPMRI